jgi:Putative prokaryotic signal transducing protein
MEKGWKQVLLTSSVITAELAKSILENEGIRAVVLNRKDSSFHLSNDEIAVYVEEHSEGKAIELLKELEN